MSSVEEFALFNTELASLVTSGLPLERAVSALARDMRKGRLKAAAEALVKSLESGVSFPDAVRAQGSMFPPLYAAILEAGIAAGDLRGALAAVAEHASRTVRVRRAVVRAVGYPLTIMFLLLVAMTLHANLLLKPMHETLGEVYGQIGIGIGTWGRIGMAVMKYAWIGLTALTGLVTITAVLLVAWRRTREGRETLDRRIVTLPIVGRFILAGFWARFCRTLGGLLRAGVPVNRALHVTRELAGNVELAGEVAAVARDVEAGKTLSDALAQRRCFPHLMTWTVSVAEKRGDLPQALAGLGDLFAEDLERRTSLWVAIIGPAMTLLAAAALVMAGLMAVYPMLTLLQGLGI